MPHSGDSSKNTPMLNPGFLMKKKTEQDELRYEYEMLLLTVVEVQDKPWISWPERQDRWFRYLKAHPNTKSWNADK